MAAARAVAALGRAQGLADRSFAERASAIAGWAPENDGAERGAELVARRGRWHEARRRLLLRRRRALLLGAVGMINSLRVLGHREPMFLLDCGFTDEQRGAARPPRDLGRGPRDAPP